MALCIRVKRKNAEEERRRLAAQGVLDLSFVPLRENEYVYFAVKEEASGKMKLYERKLRKREVARKSLSEELAGKLSKKEAEELVTSFDIVGDIAVVEIPEQLKKKQKLIAEAIMKVHHNVKVVAKKTGGTAGEFRIRPVRVIAGEKRTSTIYREAGCEFELDINKTYFSPRLGTERGRIVDLVKKGELVLVPFAGVGPFAIRVAKEVPSAKVVGIELNPDAAEYFKRNVLRNKCSNVSVLQGDVAKLLPGKYKCWADRVVMPLPKDASAFLEDIIPCLKKGGVLHYYAFGEIEKPYERAERGVKEAAGKQKRKAKILFHRIVRPYSASTVQVVIDAKID